MAKKKAAKKKKSGKINRKEIDKILAKADNPNHKKDFFAMIEKIATIDV